MSQRIPRVHHVETDSDGGSGTYHMAHPTHRGCDECADLPTQPEGEDGKCEWCRSFDAYITANRIRLRSTLSDA